MNITGQARVEIDVLDLSTLIGVNFKGIVGVIGKTEFGPIGDPKLIGSWSEFQRVFGGLQDSFIFPLLCRRALEAGAKLRVNAVGHYDDITDASSLTATKAAADLGGVQFESISPSGKYNGLKVSMFPATNGDDSKVDIQLLLGAKGEKNIYFRGFPRAWSQADVTKFNLVSNIQIVPANTDNPISAIVSVDEVLPATSALVVTYGSTGDQYGIWVNGQNIVNYTQAAGDANAAAVAIKLRDAVNAGTSGITASVSGVDLTLQAPAGTGATYNDVWVWLLNHGASYASSQLTGGVTAATGISATLSGGLRGNNTVVESDYIGDRDAGTGLYAFDKVSDVVRVACPELATPTMDDALIAYAEQRKDIRVILRTPVGLTAQGISDYRLRQGSYSGLGTGKADSWRASMTTGGLRIKHPDTHLEIEIPEIADVLACMSVKDVQYAEWFSNAGPKRGRIKNALGVVYNLGTAVREAEADNVDVLGVNPVIEHPTFGVVYWGDSTLQLADTMLKKENVAELVIFLIRSLKPLTQTFLFEPNDVITWKAIFRKVRDFMDIVKDNRGVWDYIYEGDQDISDISQASVNRPEDIDAGRYKFILGIKPKVNMKYIYIEIGVTNVGADFKILTNEPTF